MRLLVTGATGFLGWRSTVLLRERGHTIVALARPGGRRRPHAEALDALRLDAGDPDVRELVAGCDAVLHFAGVPNPTSARADPARAVRENAGTTLNLLEACQASGSALIYPSTVRVAADMPPDPYALSKQLGEEACRRHPAGSAVVRLGSVFGPGQVAREGATVAIAVFAARALEGEPIVIPGDPERTRDFLYADDAVLAMERIAAERRWEETFTLVSGVATPLVRVAELVCEAAESTSPIETPGRGLPPGEDLSYEPAPDVAGIDFRPRPIEEGIRSYVDWLRRHSPAEGSS